MGDIFPLFFYFLHVGVLSMYMMFLVPEEDRREHQIPPELELLMF